MYKDYDIDISNTTLCKQDVINVCCGVGATVLEYDYDVDLLRVCGILLEDLLKIEGVSIVETL